MGTRVPDPWRPLTDWSPPEGGVIDLWRIDLTVTEHDWETLDAEEAERARRIIIDAKRDQKAAARAHLRRILAGYVDEDPIALAFEYGEHGKPVLPAWPELSFNLSHSRATGLLAVTGGIRIGVDVEHARPGRAFEEIAERFFSSTERAYLLALSPQDRPAAFYRAWTRKEAYLKAHGTGLSFASSRFSIEYGASDAGRVLDTQMPGDRPERWRLADVTTGPDFAGAVCYEGAARVLRLWDAVAPD